MKKITLLLILSIIALSVKSQVFTSSNLPIVLINTDINPTTFLPTEIPDEPKVLATMKIIYRPDGSRNFLSDQSTPEFLHYNGRIGIELRGSTSQSLPKKPYGLTTLKADNQSNNNVALLGMPAENDWVLNALAFDVSFIRDYISYDLARSLGVYAPRGQFCEVVVNGDYKGLYILMEKIKVEQERVNIQKMTATDNSAPNVTGGFITKADKTTGGDPVAWRMLSATIDTVTFIHEYPKPTSITQQQHQYIYEQFNTLATAAQAQNASIVNGYPTLIDIPSFVDFMLINELTSNVDAYQYSVFFHKDRNGKLRAGPIWDFNLTFGNDLFQWGYNRGFANIWQFNNGDNTGPLFWKQLYDSPPFRCQFAKRWNMLSAPGQPLHYKTITDKIDSTVLRIAEAIPREKERWSIPGTHSNQIETMRYWLQARISWLNQSLQNFDACATPTLPDLVISKINYNPTAASGYTSDQLEFIELTNRSNQVVYLTGFYLRELGITFQFPARSSIEPGGRIYITSNVSAFNQFYGITPFGQYTRNLSNKSQKLSLADAFGNVIDFVEYTDAAPWPVDADGKGAFLQLRDLALDNSLASNWEASMTVSSVEVSPLEASLRMYPNPLSNTLNIESPEAPINMIRLYSMTGALLHSYSIPKSTLHTLDIRSLTAGTYLVEVTLADGTPITKRMVKP